MTFNRNYITASFPAGNPFPDTSLHLRSLGYTHSAFSVYNKLGKLSPLPSSLSDKLQVHCPKRGDGVDISKICKGGFLKQRLNNKCSHVSIWGSTEIISHEVLFLRSISQEHKVLFQHGRPNLKISRAKTRGEAWGDANNTVRTSLKMSFSSTLIQYLWLFLLGTTVCRVILWVKTNNTRAISCSFNFQLLLLTMENKYWLPSRLCTNKKPFSEFN